MTVHPYSRIWTGKTAAPTVNDDISLGYEVGDIWIDETNDKTYQAVDVTDGAAVWKYQSGGGDISGTGVIGQVAEFVTNTKTLQAAKLIGPAANILTLLAGGAYSLTIPATGTAALLETANVFTINQTITPASDVVSLTLNKPATANILNIVGTVTTTVSNAGNWGIGVAPIATSRVYVYLNTATSGDRALRVDLNSTITTGFSTAAFQVFVTGTPASASSAEMIALGGSALTAASAINHTGEYSGLKFFVNHQGTGTLSNAYGCRADIQITGVGGTITTANSFITRPEIQQGTIVTWRGYYVGTKIGTAGAITNEYGIYLEGIINGGTLNYAIFTNAGLNQLGDQLKIDGSADRIQEIVQAHSTQTANIWEVQKSDATIYIKADGTGNLGLQMGATALTAKLHIAAGGTAAGSAPLKLTTQASPLTVVEQGTFELVGNSLQFSQLAKRRGVVMSQSTLTANFTLVSSAAESATIITAEHGANYLEIGKTEEIVLRGTLQKDVGAPTNTLTIRVKYAGATIHTIVSSNAAIAANTVIEIIIVATCRTTGATGTLQINSIVRIDGDIITPAAPTLVTVNTTTAENTTVTAQFTNSSATNNLVINQGRVLCIEPNR